MATFGAAQTDDLAQEAGKAREAMLAQQYDRAVELYRKLSQASPGDAGLQKNLGLALFSASRYKEAVVQFETVLKSQSADGAIWFLLGMAHLKQDQVTLALSPLRRAVAAEPINARYRFELADALNSAGQPDESIQHFLRLTRLEPADPNAWYGLGTAYVLLTRQSFAEIERTAKETGYWYALLARSRAEQNEFRSAFYLYRQALGKLPEVRGLHATLAEIYHKTGHEDWAAVEARRELEMPKPDCNAHPLECQFFAGRFQEIVETARGRNTAEARYWRSKAGSELADKAFARLMMLPPSSASHRLQAEVFRLQNRHAESGKELEKALEFSPGDRAIQLEMAKSLRLSQDYKGAARLLAELVTHQPDAAEPNYLLGDSLLALQEAEKAIPYLEKAARLNLGERQIHVDLGRAYLQAGKIDKAIPQLKAVLDIDREGDIHYLLAQAYRQSGQQDLAQAALQRREELIKVARTSAQQRDRDYVITAP